MGDAGLRANLGQLERLQAAVRQLRSSEFRYLLLSEMAAAALDFVREEFEVSRDPYGNPWEPLKKPRSGFGGPLLKTGRLMQSVRARINGGERKFTLYSNRDYSQFHQRGTKTIPQRRFLPDELPAAWAARFEQIANEAIRRALTGVL